MNLTASVFSKQCNFGDLPVKPTTPTLNAILSCLVNLTLTLGKGKWQNLLNQESRKSSLKFTDQLTQVLLATEKLHNWEANY